MFNNISTDNSTTLLSFALHFFFMRDWCRCWSRAVLLKHTKQGDAQECTTLSLFKQSEESQQRGSWVQWRVSDWCCLVRSCLGFLLLFESTLLVHKTVQIIISLKTLVNDLVRFSLQYMPCPGPQSMTWRMISTISITVTVTISFSIFPPSK